MKQQLVLPGDQDARPWQNFTKSAIMEILEQSRVRLHQQLLRKELPAHQVNRHSVFLENARSVGVLFDATLPEERNTVLRFVDELKSKGKQVQMLGFFNEKLKIADFPFPHFDKKQLDWLFRPKLEKASDFAGQSFDLLINLSSKSILPLEYIAARSKARFRVGPFTEHTYCYDMMIDHDARKGLEAFLDQVLHYLSNMQSGKKTAGV